MKKDSILIQICEIWFVIVDLNQLYCSKKLVATGRHEQAISDSMDRLASIDRNVTVCLFLLRLLYLFYGICWGKNFISKYLITSTLSREVEKPNKLVKHTKVKKIFSNKTKENQDDKNILKSSEKTFLKYCQSSIWLQQTKQN